LIDTEFARELKNMEKVLIKKDKCKSCGLCLEYCPLHHLALSQDLNCRGMAYACVVPETKCSGCGICFTVCPEVCIEISDKL
jgi:2-oxoglutarate ferredoxin oxidoreductase subunit delta